MLTKELAVKIVLGEAHAKDYTDWAENMLKQGSGSENIAILAGLGLDKAPDPKEIKYYFNKSLKDAGLELPEKKDCVLDYARYICGEIIEGRISPVKGMHILDSLYLKTDYDPVYSIWSELSEDIWLLNDEGICLFNTGLTKDNTDMYIINVAKQFILLTETCLPENFFQLGVCRKCGYIGESRTERIEMPWLPERLFRFIYRKGPAVRSICSRCGKPDPLNMGDYMAREKYLESNLYDAI